MKRTISLICTFAMLLGLLSALIVLPTGAADIDDNLITHWNFEGDDPFADKASKGSVSDTLKVHGTGTAPYVKDGVVTITDAPLYADYSAEQMRVNADRSIAIRFRIDSVDQVAELINQNGALRLFHPANQGINSSYNQTAMGNAIWVGSNSGSISGYAHGGFAFQANTWYTLIIIHDSSNDSDPTSTKFVQRMYLVNNGTGGYAGVSNEITSDRTMNNQSSGLNGIYFGRNVFVGKEDAATNATGNSGSGVKNIEIADIRIYNKAVGLSDSWQIHTRMAAASPKDVTAAGHSLTLGDDIGVNFFLKPTVANVKNNATVTIANGEKTLLTASFADAYKTTEVTDAYKFTGKVAAKEMADQLTLTVKVGNVVYYTEKYSVLDYAKEMMADTAKYEKELPLVKAMLNYGGYAQAYFDYNTANPANKDLGLALGNVSLDDSHNAAVAGALTGVTVDATLKLESKTSVVFTVKFADNLDLTKYKVDGVTPTERTYTVVCNGVNAQELNKKVTLTVTMEGSATPITVSYAPTTYMKNALGKDGEALDNLIKALYAYYTAAAAYVAVAA